MTLVVEINLLGTMSDLRHFAIPGKNPIFLAFDNNGDVLVTPLLSGNNSVAIECEFATVEGTLIDHVINGLA
ncbi:MAG: hypothetical protein HC804_10450 [Anaerolineae bacterium]|nr:hypothetical protein [Anaerolineae bacterium]